ncbi:RNA polymerase sigma factor [Streptomyces sp. NPDC059786]|uniref:RNA polymerase sigma factor n=1 Tax=Streptomyces sp. NPDC059786 TaxID=3346946 RepID=UPI003649E6BC
MRTDEDRDEACEAALVRAREHPEAFAPLVARHSVALHGYFARRAPDAADDLLGEMWLQAYTTRRSFEPRLGTARGWLFGVARNVLSAHWRRLARERPGSALADTQAVDWAAVDARLDASALAPGLRRAVAELPFEERELLLLVAWEQLSPTEAAAAVGIPAGTARSRLYRARARLREHTELTSVQHRSANDAMRSS